VSPLPLGGGGFGEDPLLNPPPPSGGGGYKWGREKFFLNFEMSF